VDTITEQRQFGRARAPNKMPSSERLLSPKDLRDKGINYHPNHLRKLWQRGNFPAPTHLSPRKIVWREDVIDAWIASKSEAA
jgi:hypothetical protein